MSPRDQRAGKQKTCRHSKLPTIRRGEIEKRSPLFFWVELGTLTN
jgi:hypothetical protein